MKNHELRMEATTREGPLSSEFMMWRDDGEKIKELLEGSHVFTEPWDKDVAWEGWREGRRFIAEAINKDGSILDFGCANGFLLRSLQEWSVHQLEPYGFDIDESAIEKAKKLFPDNAGNFFSTEEQHREQKFPKKFDFVYWNVWDDWKFDDPEKMGILKKLQDATKEGGRLLLGFYDTKQENLKKIEQLKNRGFRPSEVIENTYGEQMLVVFDKPSQDKQ